MSGPIHYQGGLTMSLPVADMDRSIAWYRDTLGFELKYRMDEIGWCELVSPIADVTVGLSVVEKPNPGGATPTFGVANVDAAQEALAARSVKIDGDPVTIPNMVKLLTFFDPDDNALMFFERLGENEG